MLTQIWVDPCCRYLAGSWVASENGGFNEVVWCWLVRGPSGMSRLSVCATACSSDRRKAVFQTASDSDTMR
jgi:hypothetical protein